VDHAEEAGVIVVADTSPINYLLLIDMVYALPCLFDEVVVPHAVMRELLDTRAPAPVAAWASKPPRWFKVVAASSTTVISPLNPGESEAITLVQDIQAEALLIDERVGREEAMRRGIEVMGTLGVLATAARDGHIDPALAVERLRRTSFRASPAQFARVLSGRARG
jgi:predicted nucleic acid-binding protein